MAPPPVQIKSQAPKNPKQKTTELTDEAQQAMSEGETMVWLFLLGSSSIITLIADTVGLTGVGLIATFILDVYPVAVNTAYSIRLVMLGQFSFIDALLGLASIVVPGSTLFRFLSKLKKTKDALEEAKSKIQKKTAPIQKATSLNVGKLKAATTQLASRTSILAGRTENIQPTQIATPQEISGVTQNEPPLQPGQQIQYAATGAPITTTQTTEQPQKTETEEKRGDQEDTVLTDAARFYLAPETGKEYAELITKDSEQPKKTESTQTTTTTPKPSPTAIATKGRLAQKKAEVGREEDQKIEILTQAQSSLADESVPTTQQPTTPVIVETPIRKEEPQTQKEPSRTAPTIPPKSTEKLAGLIPDTRTGFARAPIGILEQEQEEKPKTLQIPEAPQGPNGIFAPLEQFAKQPPQSQTVSPYIEKNISNQTVQYPTYDQVINSQTQYQNIQQEPQTVNVEIPSVAEGEIELPTEYPVSQTQIQEAPQNILTSGSGAEIISKQTPQVTAGQQTTKTTAKQEETPDIFKTIEEDIVTAGEKQEKKEEIQEEGVARQKTKPGTSQNILDLRERFKKNKQSQRATETQEELLETTRKEPPKANISVIESIENRRQELQKQKNLAAQTQKEIHEREAEKRYRTLIGLETDTENTTQQNDQNKKAA